MVNRNATMDLQSPALIEQLRQSAGPLQPQPTGTDSRLTPLPDIRAVCFDVYGTLLISGSGDIGLTVQQDRSPALHKALLGAGFSLAGPTTGLADAFYKVLKAHSDARRQQGFPFPEIRIEMVWHDFIEQLRHQGRLNGQGDLPAAAVRYETTINPVYPMPGMASLLRELHQRQFRLGIVSNAQFFTPLLFPAFLHQSLPELGFSKNLCLWSYEEEIGKPDPALFQLLAFRLSQFNIAPQQTLYLGNDMRNDIAPAAQTGFRTALFAGDARSLRLRHNDPLVGSTQPDAVLTALHQLPQLLP